MLLSLSNSQLQMIVAVIDLDQIPYSTKALLNLISVGCLTSN